MVPSRRVRRRARSVAASLWARTAWTSGFSARAARGHLAGRHGRALEGLIADLLPPSDVDALDRTLVLDCRLGLVDDMLHYFDRTSMAHALEVRVPFLDHRVVGFCDEGDRMAIVTRSYKV